MDQMVSSVGGFVFIDFEDTDNPKIEKLSCQFEDAGYMLCITDTKGSHADLTDDYVSIPAEMNLVAAQFGKKSSAGSRRESVPAGTSEIADCLFRPCYFACCPFLRR